MTTGNQGGGGPGKPTAGGVVKRGAEGLAAAISALSKQMDEIQSQIQVPEFGLCGAVDSDIQRLASLEKSLRSFARAGAPFAKGGNLNNAISQIGEKFDELVGSADVGIKAVNGLFGAMEQFGQLGEVGTLGKVTMQLAEQAAVFEKFGLGYSQYAQQVELSQNMLNMTKEQILGLNQGLMDFSNEMRLMPGLVSRNFQLVAKSLAYDAPKIVEQFKQIQKMSSQTGVSVGTLMSGMGDRLDSIGGAAQFTGQLNAILGRNAFSPNQIMMMDEAERIVKIREVIQTHPIMGEINSGSKLGKFALRSISKIVGFSKEDTRKYLTGELDPSKRPAGSTPSMKEQLSDAISGKDPTGAKLFDSASGKLSAELVKNGQSATENRDALIKNTRMLQNAFLSTQDQVRANERGRNINVFDKNNQALKDQALRLGQEKLLVDFGETSELENIIPGVNPEEIVRATSRMPQLRQMIKTLQTLPQGTASSFRKRVGKLIKQLGGATAMTPQQRAEGRDDFNETLQIERSDMIAFRKQDDPISPLEAFGINIVRSVAPNAFGAVRRLQRIARTKSLTEAELSEAIKGTVGMDGFGISEDQQARIMGELGKSGQFGGQEDSTGGNTPNLSVPLGPSAPNRAPPIPPPIRPPGEQGFNTNQSVDYFFAGLQNAFKSMTLEIPLGDGTAEQIVGGVLKRKFPA